MIDLLVTILYKAPIVAAALLAFLYSPAIAAVVNAHAENDPSTHLRRRSSSRARNASETVEQWEFYKNDVPDVHPSLLSSNQDHDYRLLQGSGSNNVRLSLVETLLQTFVLQSLEAYLTYSGGVAADFTGEGPFTVMTPWDIAFDNLDEDWVTKLRDRAWGAHLRDLLRYHIYEGDLNPDNLSDRELVKMRNGESVVITRQPGSTSRFRVNNVLVLATYNATNGYAYMLQNVLRPRWMDTPILVEIASMESFTTLYSLIERTELMDTFWSGSLTFFAPTNEAFDNLDQQVLDQLLADENIDLLRNTLLYHIVPDGPFPANFFPTPLAKSLVTLHGQALQIVPTGGDTDSLSFRVQGGRSQANITDVDRVFRNGEPFNFKTKLDRICFHFESNFFLIVFSSICSSGLIHVIDSVLLPEPSDPPVSTWGFEAKVVGQQQRSNFGIDVAVSGNTMAVGVLPRNAAAGYVHMYIRDGNSWSFETIIRPDENDMYDFGAAVALDGNTLVVGATEAQATGSAYVYVRTNGTWQQETELDIDRAQGTYYLATMSVAIDDGIIVVGFPYHEYGGGDSWYGRAFVFSRSDDGSWRRTGALQPDLGPNPPSALSANFGMSVAVHNSTIAVGASRDYLDLGSRLGIAYVFVWSDETQTWSKQAKLKAPEGIGSSVSVAIEDDTLAIGYPRVTETGIIYIFNRANEVWTLDTELTVDSANSDDNIGYSVSLKGGVLVTGSYESNARAGAAYVFSQSENDWEFVTRLTAFDRELVHDFGKRVAIDGSLIAVSAPLDDDIATDSGSVYVFEEFTSPATATNEIPIWDQGMKLTPDDFSAGDSYGTSVAVSGDTMAVYAPRSGNADESSVYIFVHDGTSWEQEARLVKNGHIQLDAFGNLIALDQDTLVIGSQSSADDDTPATVDVYFRINGSWSLQAELSVEGIVSSDLFGKAVAIYNDTIVIGAPNENNENVQDSGSVYVFVRNGSSWEQQARLVAYDPEPLDNFGFAVAIEGERLVVGAPNGGKAYVFTRSGGTWSFPFKLNPIIDGQKGTIFGATVSIRSERIVVSSPGNEGAYIFGGLDGIWSHQDVVFTAGDTIAAPGMPVSINDDVVVVGTPDRGLAYVYARKDREYFFLTQLAFGADISDRFGWSLDMSPNGKWIVVGDPHDDEMGVNAGAIHVFRK